MQKLYKIKLSSNDECITPDQKFNSSAFTVKELGNYVADNPGWHISRSFIREHLLPENNNVINLQDKNIYRYPKLTLPTQKVDLLKDKYNLKVTRKVDTADYRIVSTKYFESLLENSWDKSYPFTIGFKFFKHLVEEKLLSESGYTKVKQIVEGLPKDCMLIIERPWSYGSSTKLTVPKFEFPDHRSNRIVYIKKDMVPTMNDIISTNPEKIIFDTEVSDIIDEGLAEISDDEFETIKQMITSGDKDSRSLAVEMLANCNINKSFNVVSYLYYWHYNWFKDSSNWQSVNVKSFRKRMKKYEGGTSEGIHSYNQYIQLLIEDEKLTTFVLNKTRERLYKNILGSIIGDTAAVFKMPIDCLNINEEMQKHIDE